MQHINSFMGGMKGGVDYTIIPQDSYLYLLNGCIISRDDHGFVITSVKGTEQIASFDANEVPIGSTSFNGILYIITHKIVGSGAFICVYSYKGSNGTTWVDQISQLPNLDIPQILLGYSRNKLLQVFAKESYDGSVDLYICDGLSPNSVINTGVNRDGRITDRVYKKISPIEFALQRSITKAPTVKSIVRNTGNLKPGTYYFYLRYEDDSMNATPFIVEHGPIFIHSGIASRDNVSGVLNEDNSRVSKNIVLQISNSDPLYNKISVAVVHYFGYDLILSRDNYIVDKTYTLNGGGATIVINGDNAVRSITVEEIVSDNLQYNTSETHLQLDNRYYGANWSGKSVDYKNLKELAEMIIPHAVLKNESGFDDVYDENASEFEYMEDEIYPFGVAFLIDGRYKTPVFPVCGWYEGDNPDVEILRVPEKPKAYINVVDQGGITETSAILSGQVVSKDGVAIYNTYIIGKAGDNPTVTSYDFIFEVTPGPTGQFSHEFTNLLADTAYGFQVYAKIQDNTFIYSPYGYFETRVGILTVRTTEPFQISSRMAFCGGLISDEIGGDISLDGITNGLCWNTTGSPNIIDDHFNISVSQNNPFTLDLGYQDGAGHDVDLIPNTEYYVSAYATNIYGTSYGEPKMFTTKSEDITLYIMIEVIADQILIECQDRFDDVVPVTTDITVWIKYKIDLLEDYIEIQTVLHNGFKQRFIPIDEIVFDAHIIDVSPKQYNEYFYSHQTNV